MVKLTEKRLYTYEEFLQSEILIYCIKKSVMNPRISPEFKVKILFLLYERSFDSKEEHANLFLENPLGIDDDLLDKPSEVLTADQVNELRKLMFEEVKKFHSLLLSLSSGVKYLPAKAHPRDSFMTLKSNISKQILALNECIELQKKIESIKSEAYSYLEEKCKSIHCKLRNLLSDHWKLIGDIDEIIIDGDRGKRLDDVEEMLETKIKKNEEKIGELKFKLSEYSG